MDKIESIMRILPQSVREIFCHAEIAMEKLQDLYAFYMKGKSSLSTMQAECREEYRGHIL